MPIQYSLSQRIPCTCPGRVWYSLGSGAGLRCVSSFLRAGVVCLLGDLTGTFLDPLLPFACIHGGCAEWDHAALGLSANAGCQTCLGLLLNAGHPAALSSHAYTMSVTSHAADKLDEEAAVARCVHNDLCCCYHDELGWLACSEFNHPRRTAGYGSSTRIDETYHVAVTGA